MAIYVSSKDLPVVFEVTDSTLEDVTRAVGRAMAAGTVPTWSGSGEALAVNFGRIAAVRIGTEDVSGGVLGTEKWSGTLDKFLQ